MIRVVLAIGVALGLCAFGQTDQRKWKSVYFYDQDQADLILNDIAAGPKMCSVAVGMHSHRGRLKPVAVLTSDSAKTWKIVDLKERPRSVFLLTDQAGWMVTDGGVWRTSDCGQTWEKLYKEKLFARLWFLDEKQGFAAGAPKKLMETADGGKTWRKVGAADEPKSNPERTVYSWIYFGSTQRGFVGGWHDPERSNEFELPAWMDPEQAQRRRQRPSLSLILQTIDGGKSWNATSSSIFGKVTRIKVNSKGQGLALVEFSAGFEWPSEVFHLVAGKNETVRAFREKDRVVTDVAVWESGAGLLATLQPPGELKQMTIPGKVRIFESADLSKWREMPVDYRAVGRRVMLAGKTPEWVLVATDTGMILRLE